MSELDIEADPGERRATRVDARPVKVLLHQNLRHVVADLGSHDRDRVTVGGVPGGNQLPVRLESVTQRRLAQEGRAHRPVTRNRDPGRTGGPQRSRGARHRRAGRSERDRARVGHRETGAGERRRRLVRERLGHSRRRLGVVLLAEVRPRGVTGGAAEALLEGLERQRGAQLVASSLAKDPANQRGLRDHIGRRPVRRHLADPRILGG